MDPFITRHRFETRRRALTVAATEYLTPRMIRITLTGEDLADFASPGFDDHVKLFFPAGGDRPEMRDYTPRAFDRAARRLVVDFALHDAGPATAWALAARPGDALQVGGPRGSAVIEPVFDWYLLIGDETALPAMGRRVEELGAGTEVITLGAVTGAAEEQVFATAARHAGHWVHRPAEDAANPSPVLAALGALTLPPGKGFVWIAAESAVARALRDHVTGPMGHPRAWTKAAGYWQQGQADSHTRIDD